MVDYFLIPPNCIMWCFTSGINQEKLILKKNKIFLFVIFFRFRILSKLTFGSASRIINFSILIRVINDLWLNGLFEMIFSQSAVGSRRNIVINDGNPTDSVIGHYTRKDHDSILWLSLWWQKYFPFKYLFNCNKNYYNIIQEDKRRAD